MTEQDAKLREMIRKRLIQCRTDNQLTQTDVARVAGKSKNAVASWEQGLSLPDIYTLYRLSKYYKVSMEYLYENNPTKKWAPAEVDAHMKGFVIYKEFNEDQRRVEEREWWAPAPLIMGGPGKPAAQISERRVAEKLAHDYFTKFRGKCL